MYRPAVVCYSLTKCGNALPPSDRPSRPSVTPALHASRTATAVSAISTPDVLEARFESELVQSPPSQTGIPEVQSKSSDHQKRNEVQKKKPKPTASLPTPRSLMTSYRGSSHRPRGADQMSEGNIRPWLVLEAARLHDGASQAPSRELKTPDYRDWGIYWRQETKEMRAIKSIRRDGGSPG